MKSRHKKDGVSRRHQMCLLRRKKMETGITGLTLITGGPIVSLLVPNGSVAFPQGSHTDLSSGKNLRSFKEPSLEKSSFCGHSPRFQTPGTRHGHPTIRWESPKKSIGAVRLFPKPTSKAKLNTANRLLNCHFKMNSRTSSNLFL